MAHNFKKNGGSCSAIGCTMRRGTNLLSEVKMFRFPSDPVRRTAWCNALKRKDWFPTNYSLLCNAHFISGKPSPDPEHPDYVPTVFCFKKRDAYDDEKMIQQYKRSAKCSRSHSVNVTSSNIGIQIKCPTLKKIAICGVNLPDTPAVNNMDELRTIPVKSKKTILMSCCVKNCESTFKKDSNIIYHRFPLDNKDLTRKWIECVGLENFVPSENLVLCSLHFTLDNYKNGIVSAKHLHCDAVPTVFDHPAENPIKKKNAHKAKKISTENVTENTFESVSNTELSFEVNKINNPGENSSNASILLGNELQIYNKLIDIDSASDSEEEIDYFFNIDSLNLEEIKEKLDHMTTHYKRTQARLKLCQKRCSLYKKEINALRQVISSLQQINSVMDDS